MNVKTLCQSVIDVATERYPVLTPKANFLNNTFTKAFTYFANCRHIYDSGKILSDEEILELRKHYNALVTNLTLTICTIEAHIDKFLEFYRESFPGATITPKLHMMEDHVVPFLQKWKRGLGLLGEQGAESIHARFNSIRTNYSNMRNKVERLECIMREHYNQLCPDNIVRLPEIKRRKKNTQ